MASLLPNGKQQFCDANGQPYASGQVYFYIPNTLTLKATYQDIGQTISNPNPVVLDAAGRAVIFGNGTYRQVLYDSIGNLVWDQITSSVVSQAMEAVVGASTLSAAMVALGISLPMQPVVGAATLAAARAALGVFGSDGGVITTPPSFAINPIGNPTIPTLVSFGTQIETASETTREFGVSFGFTINKGSTATANNQDKVAVYAAVDMVAGAGDGWAHNSVTTLESTCPVASNAFGYECDFNNLNAHRGDAAAGAGLAAPIAYGIGITGASTFRSTAALLIGGASGVQWNRGIVLTDAVIQASIQDFSNSTIGYEMYGTHTYGFDLNSAAFTGAAIRIGNSYSIKSRNAAGSADLALLTLDNANNIEIGGTGVAGNFVFNSFFPNVDNTYLLGGPSNRWSVVYAGTGTINTSDATEKTVRGAPSDAELAAWASMTAKVFTLEGGTRLHIGYLAQDAAAALTAQGLTPADYGLWCKDDWTDEAGIAHTRQGLRYDEIAVLESALTRKRIADLEARIAVLEGKLA